MWTLIIAGAVLAGTYVYHRWIEDHPPPPRPADINVPRVDEGAPIPLVYGRCRVRSPVLVWSGNLVLPESVGGDYNLDMMFVIGIPFYGGLTTLGSSVVAPAGFNGTGGMYTGDLLGYGFGGLIEAHTVDHAIYVNNDVGATGQSCVASFYPGSPYQNLGETTNPSSGPVARDNMVAGGVTASLIPGYRNQIVFFGEFDIGPNPTPPAFGFEVVSLSTGTTAFMGQSLPYDADPAAVLYDMITSPWGKLGLPVAIIDLPSFLAASLTLYTEGHGYSRSFEGTFDASEAIGDLLQQTDGILYQEPTNGKLVYKLVRADYNVIDLVDINPSNVVKDGDGKALINYAIQGWNETFNQVRLTFTDRTYQSGSPLLAGIYADGLAIAQNGANAFFQGRLRPVDVRYPGCCDRVLAQNLASRELAVVSKPTVKATITVNRTFYAHRPGDVVTFTWPELGIDHMVMRIARADFGQLHDGRIVLDLIRDVFDVQIGAFPVG